MAVSFTYWDGCIDPEDLDTLWMDPDVRTEWINAGETRWHQVHLSRDPDGQPYLTETEMKGVARIIVGRHFVSEIDPDMICAIAELESHRQPTCTWYNKKTDETTMGLMQILPKTADWLVRDFGYRKYEVEGNSKLLYKPFVNVYFGAAYLKWLSSYDQKERSEEFMVRAYKGGIKKATDKSTLNYWNQYLAVKECLPPRKVFQLGPMLNKVSAGPLKEKTGVAVAFWDSRASPEDLEQMWNHPDVRKDWRKSGKKKGKVKFSVDAYKRPCVSQVELRAVAEIILSKYFSNVGLEPAFLCALAEIISMRVLNGIGPRPGIMGIDYPTAHWLYKHLGYKAYNVNSAVDVTKPFVSMYFGTAYLGWLSYYKGKQRSSQFVVQAYFVGPEKVNLQDMSTVWTKFEEAWHRYDLLATKKQGSSCTTCTIL
ncbi:uncharacterized protein LOC127811758 isoform X2 [Diospyros lotus]|uniref:uncharacterized protein LOC127811758 isoform X2 n=1 Tax=Diospyros lotus TaxID=55363 RepID=UPI00225264E6|nr:uncharacterized protein LOC127811758 isoform X2 [Diospyros lotus]